MTWVDSMSPQDIDALDVDSEQPNPLEADAQRAPAKRRTKSASRWGYASFVLLTAVLFLRPGDIVPALDAAPVYLASLVLALVMLRRPFLAQLQIRNLIRRPITILVFGVMFSAILSQVVHGDHASAISAGEDCLKFVVYYLLLVAAIDSPERLRSFLAWLAVFALVVCGLGLLNYHGLINVNAPPYMEQQDYNDPDTGQPAVLARLVSVGIFNNPNDVSRLALFGILACLYCLGLKKSLPRRAMWLGMIAVMAYAMVLTYSRGGTLALLAGIGALGILKFGRARTVMIAAILMPVAFLISGRMGNFDASTGTAQERILLWRDAFDDMKSSPIFGIGAGEFGLDEGGLVAHNSFMQVYTEMGLIGGTIFTGAFYLALWGLWRLKPEKMSDPQLRRQRLYLLAIVSAAVVGMFSSTRSFRVDTYLLLGMVTVFTGFAFEFAPKLCARWNFQLIKRLIIASIVTLIVFNLYVRLEAQ